MSAEERVIRGHREWCAFLSNEGDGVPVHACDCDRMEDDLPNAASHHPECECAVCCELRRLDQAEAGL